MPNPKQVWQHSNGVLTTTRNWLVAEVLSVPRQSDSFRVFKEGFVDHIDPAIEACFRLLGQVPAARTIILTLDHNMILGLEESQWYGHGQFGLDIPIEIERCWREYTTGGGISDEINVRWEGTVSESILTNRREAIKDLG